MIGWVFGSHQHTFGTSSIPHAVLMHLHVSAEEKKVTSDSDETYQKGKRAVRFVCNHISLKFQIWNEDWDAVVQIWTSERQWQSLKDMTASYGFNSNISRHETWLFGSEAACTESVYSLAFLPMLENKLMILYLQVLFLRKKLSRHVTLSLHIKWQVVFGMIIWECQPSRYVIVVSI